METVNLHFLEVLEFILERIKEEMGSFILLYSNGHTFTIYIMYSVLEMYVQHNEYTNFIYNNILNIRKGFKIEKIKKGLNDTYINYIFELGNSSV